MAKTSNCLQLIDRMPQEDQDALVARLDELQAQGLSPKEAQLQAAIDVLAQVEREGGAKMSPEREGYVVIQRYGDSGETNLATSKFYATEADANEARGDIEFDDDYGDSEYIVRKATADDFAIIDAADAETARQKRDSEERARKQDAEAAKRRAAWESRPQEQKDAEAAERRRVDNANRKINERARARYIADMEASKRALREEAKLAGNPSEWVVIATSSETGERTEVRRIAGETSAEGLQMAKNEVSLLEQEDDISGDTYSFEPVAEAKSSTARDVTDTPEFKAWFGDSKVVDAEGRPMVVYHGTTKEFKEFKQKARSPDLGFHFGTRDQADAFSGGGSGSRVLPVYLSIKSPLHMRDVFGKWRGALYQISAELERLGVVDTNERRKIDESRSQVAGIEIAKNAIRRAGYDGISYQNNREGVPATELPDGVYFKHHESVNGYKVTAHHDTFGQVGAGASEAEAMADASRRLEAGSLVQPSQAWIALYPEQIKSAIGNRGTFDPKDADITRSQDRDLDGFRKELLGKVQANVAMAKMRGAGHEWSFNVGDQLLSTKTGQVFRLTGRTFQRVGKLKDNDWQPVYSYETGRPPPANATREEKDNWPHDYQQGILQEKAILESKTLKSLNTPIMRSAERSVLNLVRRASADAKQEIDSIVDDAIAQTSQMTDIQAIEHDKLEEEIVKAHRLVDSIPEGPRKTAIKIMLDEYDSDIDEAFGAGTLGQFPGPDGANSKAMRIQLAQALSGLGGVVMSAERSPWYSQLERATDAPEFKRWFGDSKVVDESGRPMVMYHGTSRGGFAEFDRNKTLEWRGPSMDTVGSWFSNNPSDKDGAGLYAAGGNSTIYPVYLSIANPKRYSTFQAFLRDMHKAAGRKMPESAPGRGSTEELRAKLKAEGYDGIEFEQTANESLMQDIKEMQDTVERAKQDEFSVKRADRLPYTQKRERLEQTLKSMRQELDEFGSSTEFDGQRVFIAFEPGQIKSAIGNDGSFDPGNPDITRSRERTETPEFKAWSGDAKLVMIGDSINPSTFKSGRPVVVEALHGTTHDITEFDGSKSNIESDWGGGFYASNTPSDVMSNYASEDGPDLQQRIELLAERTAGDQFDDDMDAARDAARSALSGGAPNTMKLFIRFRNPAVVGGRGETQLEVEEEYDEEADSYGEPTGKLIEFVEALDRIAPNFNNSRSDIQRARDEILGKAYNTGEGVSIGEIKDAIFEHLVDSSNDDGQLAASEIARLTLKEIGFDGIIDTTVYKKFRDMSGMRPGTVHFIAFEPAQLKSAIGNDGSFDDNDPSILSSAARAWATPGASKFDDIVYKMQDKQVDLKRIVEAVKDARGEIRNDIDTYLQEELFHGRAAKRTEDFVNKELQPLVDEMARRGLTIEDLDQYLHARHAKEANELVAERNPDSPDLQDGGSGMKTQEAQHYLASLGADQREHLSAAAAMVDKMLAKTRKLVIDYELEGKDTVNSWGEMFDHYVPLMREDDGDAPQRLGTGQGFSIKGREVKSRTGSKKKVVDILANIAMQRERTIVRGEKNRVAQSLVGLASANPNKDFWAVDLTPTTPTFDPKKGVVVQRPDPMFKARPNVVVAKIRDDDGSVKEHAVIFSEKDGRALRTAAAMKNLDAAQLEGLMGASATVTRYFAAVNTQYNPVFGIVNLVRDVQGALINLQTTELAGKQKAIAKSTLSALRGIYADARSVRGGKSATSAWADLWEDFQDVGGQTGFRQLFATSNDRAEAIKKTLDPNAWMDSKLGKIFTANGALKVPLAVAMKGAKWIFDWLSDYNLAMENGIRLATYKAGLDNGMSKERAASLAKNLTVNFNRKGQIGQQAGAVYAFFNASMQGTARLGQVLFDMEPGKPKTMRLSGLGKKVVYGGITLGAMQALALAAAGFDDNDPPDFARERALIIPTGGKTYLSIPMPLGFHVIPGIGRMTAEWALGGFKDTPERFVKMLGMFADTFNPIGNAGLSMQTLAPTALDPLVALTENKDWQGRPIAKESMNKAVPGHALARDTATAWARLMSEAVNTATGGNDYVAGAISPTPDQIDYLIGQVTGGVGREISKVEQTAKSTLTGEELPLFKIPVVGRFAGNAASQSSEGNAFYANSEGLNKLETEIKGLQKDGKTAEAAALRASRPDSYMIAQVNMAERQIAKLRKEKSELVKAGAERAQVRAVEEKITARMAALNRAAAALKERQAALQ